MPTSKVVHGASKSRDHLRGRGSVDSADALKGDLLSIQNCSQAVPTRCLPPIAGIGKVGVLKRAVIHPKHHITLKRG
jgi:hypothetical protein